MKTKTTNVKYRAESWNGTDKVWVPDYENDWYDSFTDCNDFLNELDEGWRKKGTYRMVEIKTVTVVTETVVVG